jgi:hypothetical protein
MNVVMIIPTGAYVRSAGIAAMLMRLFRCSTVRKVYSFRNRNCQNVTVKYPAVPIMRLIR